MDLISSHKRYLTELMAARRQQVLPFVREISTLPAEPVRLLPGR